jgi:hypothetical protein
MPGRRPIKAVIALAAIAGAATGCGSSSPDITGTIPSTTADVMQRDLDNVTSRVARGDCEGARVSAQAFLDVVSGLQSSSGEELRTALEGAGQRLEQLTTDRSQCQPSGTTSGFQGPKPTTTTPTTTPTATAPPTTTTTTASTTSTTTRTTGGGGGDTGTGGGGTGGGTGGDTGGTGGGTGG